MAAHTLQSVTSRDADRVTSGLMTVPEHERRAARIVADAITAAGDPGHREIAIAAGMSGTSGSKVSRWTSGDCSPGLVHLVRLAPVMPRLVAGICRGLLDLCSEAAHVSRPLPERVCQCMAEVGDVAREVHLALADGRVDAGERARILTEIGEARRELDRLERDLG